MRKVSGKKRVFSVAAWLVALSVMLVSCLQILRVDAPTEVHTNSEFEVTMVLDDNRTENTLIGDVTQSNYNCYGYLGIQLPEGWTIDLADLTCIYYGRVDEGQEKPAPKIIEMLDDQEYINKCFTNLGDEGYKFVGFSTKDLVSEVLDSIVVKIKVHTDGQTGDKFLKLYVQENGKVDPTGNNKDENKERPPYPMNDDLSTKNPSRGEHCEKTINLKVLPQLTISSLGDNATATGHYEVGATVTIKAGDDPIGYQFVNWTTSDEGVEFNKAEDRETTITMPAGDATVTANFEKIPYTLTISGGGEGASESGTQYYYDLVEINAGTPTEGQGFFNWTADPSVTFTNAEASSTTFRMPASEVTVTAHFDVLSKVTVTSTGEGATGEGNYVAGKTVTISAGTAPAGTRFTNWTSDDVTITNETSATATFTMPQKAVTVTANFGTLYAVTVEGGTSDSAAYLEGETVTLTAAAAELGWAFTSWTSESSIEFDKDDSSTATFTMPASEVTVTATFTKTPYTITVEDGTSNPEETATFGETITVTASDKDGHRFSHWTSDPAVEFGDAKEPSTTFTMPIGNIKVTAVFNPLYALTVTVEGLDAVNKQCIAGETVYIDAGEDPELRRFTHWTTNPESAGTFTNATDRATTFTMPDKAVEVSAVYEQLYTVTVESEDAVGAEGGGAYAAGETVTITAGTKEHFLFVRWESESEVVIDQPTSATAHFPMIAEAVTVTAVFEPLYAVTIADGGTGHSGAGEYPEHKIVNIKAGTTSGHRFIRWTADVDVAFDNPSDANTHFAMPASAVTVTAVFEPIYRVTISSLGAGATGAGDYLEGERVVITAGTNSDYRFLEWTASPTVVFDQAKAASTHFLMLAEPVTVTANFARLYAVTVAEMVNGKATVDNTPAIAGETVTLHLAPDNGYETDAVGVHLTGTYRSVALAGEGPTRTFVMPEGGATITATFKKTRDHLDLDDAVRRIESVSLVLAQEEVNTQDAALAWLVERLNSAVQGTGVVVPERNIWMYNFSTAVAGTSRQPAGRDGGFSANVSLSKNGVYANLSISGTITATPFIPTDIDAPQSGKLNAFVQNGVLRVSGLVGGETWSVYHVSGRLIRGQVATGSEATLPLAVRGVYLVRTGKALLKVVY
jgi:hypothetical protein